MTDKKSIGLAEGNRLLKLCQHRHNKEELKSPFPFGDLTAATNGHVLVVVPNRPEFGERAAPVKIDGIYRKIEEATDWHPLPDINWPDSSICEICLGSGWVSAKDCKECGGDGEVELHNKFSSYLCDCASCGGDGEIIQAGGDDFVCESCAGSGVSPSKRWASINVLGVDVQEKYLRLINYPFVQVAAANDGLRGADNAMLLFRQVIDGQVVAEGSIMGMRK